MELPRVVHNKAREAGATRWLSELPHLIAHCERAWGIQVGRTYDEGTEAFVAEARTADGEEVVLKLPIPREGDVAKHEITVLRLCAGEGCARLLRADEDRGALLMERLGVSLHALGLPIERRHAILCSAAARVWRPAPDCGLPSGADKGQWLIEYITRMHDELAGACTQRAVDHALRCAERRIAAHDEGRAVLVHGDVHEWNALQADEGFKLVDPDGLLAEAEYDMGILMREDPLELLQGDPCTRARALARRTGLDAAAIWQWGVVERVSTGLLCTRIGLQPVGRQMLEAADRVAGLELD